MFTRLYNFVIELVQHRRAPAYLYGLTACESIFFPIPTDVMLAPMCATQPRRAVIFSWWTTVFSVLGGVIGYAIGYFLLQQIVPHLSDKWLMHYNEAVTFFDEWGGAAVIIAAITPIPYKVFTITAGGLMQSLTVFILASFVGRGLRFFAVGMLCALLGPPAIKVIEKRIEFWGWMTVAAIVIAIVVYQFGVF